MKAGELQRTMSLLWFLRGHVIVTLHSQIKWRLVRIVMFIPSFPPVSKDRY